MVEEVDHYKAAVDLARVHPQADHHAFALEDLLERALEGGDHEQVHSVARNEPTELLAE